MNSIAQTIDQALKKPKVPALSEVGASNFPSDIAPVKAPFSITQFKRPVFPSFSLAITNKGAKPEVLSTKAIQATIDEVSQKGGGMVIVPAGKWKTGRISLKSNVNLHISEGAELNFSPDVEDYRPAVFTRNEGIEVMSLGALIYANGQENIAVTGKGTLIGPGEGSVRKQILLWDVVENAIPLNKSVSERVYEGFNGSPILPPMFISPINCKKVFIEGVSLKNTAFWNIVPEYCDGVIIRGVTINSVGIPRGDGIDIESSRNVLIEYCTLSNGDDCFTIKSGRGEDGLRVNKPSENIVVRNCLALEGAGGVTCGSETAGMIRNLYVHDCVFEKTTSGIRFKTRRPRGGGGENLTYERIYIKQVGDAIKFDMLGSKNYVGELASRLPARPVTKMTPKYRNILIRDIVVESANSFIDMQGIPESPITNVVVESALANTKGLFKASDVRDIVIRNSKIKVQNSDVRVLDGRNITFEKVKFEVPNNVISSSISGDLSENIRFIKCSPEKPQGWLHTSWNTK